MENIAVKSLDELIEEYCSDGVEFVPLGELFHIRKGYTPSKANKDYWENGTIPWFRMDDIRQNGRILSDSLQHITTKGVRGKLFPAGSIIMSTLATIGEHALITTESIANDQFKIFTKNEDTSLLELDMKYAFYYFFIIGNWCKKNTQDSSFSSVGTDKLKKYKMPIPSIDVQRKIVEYLDRFTELTKELTKELTARRKQYEYYRDKLLNFEGRKDVKWVKLWTVTIWDKKFNSVDKEKQAKIIKYPYLLANDLFSLSQDEGDVFLLSTGEETGWTTEEISGKYLCEGEVVAIPWGKSRPLKDVIKYYKGKFVTADNRIAISFDTNILLNKYLYYWMFSQGEKIDAFYRGSGIKHPFMPKILDMKIPLPSLEEQERIVEILDKFDLLVNDITDGLPAEIESREKQYEYYRNKLLTFKEKI